MTQFSHIPRSLNPSLGSQIYKFCLKFYLEFHLEVLVVKNQPDQSKASCHLDLFIQEPVLFLIPLHA